MRPVIALWSEPTPRKDHGSSLEATGSYAFTSVKRGYDPQQVDEHVRNLHAALAETRQAHERERLRADHIEKELQETKLRLERIAEEQGNAHGFGQRLENLLRTAAQEAAELRNSATQEATALLEQARADAEAHRHEVEQSLIMRIATLDQEAAQRKVALDEREREIAEQTEAAREQAARMLAEARRQAEEIHREAKAQADADQREAEEQIRQRHDVARMELDRLRRLHDDVRGQLAELLETLTQEFDHPVEEDDHPPQTEPLRIPTQNWTRVAPRAYEHESFSLQTDEPGSPSSAA